MRERLLFRIVDKGKGILNIMPQNLQRITRDVENEDDIDDRPLMRSEASNEFTTKSQLDTAIEELYQRIRSEGGAVN